MAQISHVSLSFSYRIGKYISNAYNFDYPMVNSRTYIIFVGGFMNPCMSSFEMRIILFDQYYHSRYVRCIFLRVKIFSAMPILKEAQNILRI